MSSLILPDVANDALFRDAPIKALRLRGELPAPEMKLTPKAKVMMDEIIDNLGPLQVIGGKRTTRGQEVLDVWFPAVKLFDYWNLMTPPGRQGLIALISSVAVDFTPGPEVVAAMANPDDEDRIVMINDLCGRYCHELVRYGAPEPGELLRKRCGAPK